jgi:nicotinamide-nucleotide amidase
VKAEIISIGTEIILGEITDTNASFLASQLPSLGIDLYWVSQVGDSQPRMVEVLKRSWGRSELILVTGGLGPTGDDLTREAIAETLGEKMAFEPSLEKTLRDRYSRNAMVMPESNMKQATLIPSARAIPNPNGTAPGWFVSKDGRTIIAMPGPPGEMQPMWRERVVPELAKKAENVIITKTIKTSGLSEAAVGELVAPLFSLDNPTFGIYAKPDGIQLRLAAKAKTRAEAEKILAGYEAGIKKSLNEYIWGTDDDTIVTVVGRLLNEKRLTLGVMEDFSGGWLATSITDIKENANFFKGGLVACSDAVKTSFGVDPGIISKYGAVSPETAREMASAARKLLKSDIGIAITGTIETPDRPNGITYVGIADKNRSEAFLKQRRKPHIGSLALAELRKWLLSDNPVS